MGQIYMALPFCLRGDRRHGRIRKDDASPQSHRGTFPHDWVPLTQDRHWFEEACPSAGPGHGLPAQHFADVMPYLTQNNLNRRKHASSLCPLQPLGSVLVPGQWCAVPGP